MDLLLYLPADAKKPVPVFLNIGFSANSSTVEDPGIKPGEVDAVMAEIGRLGTSHRIHALVAGQVMDLSVGRATQ